MFSRFICVVVWSERLHLFYDWIIFCCMDISHFVSPLIQFLIERLSSFHISFWISVFDYLGYIPISTFNILRELTDCYPKLLYILWFYQENAHFPLPLISLHPYYYLLLSVCLSSYNHLRGVVLILWLACSYISVAYMHAWCSTV